MLDVTSFFINLVLLTANKATKNERSTSRILFLSKITWAGVHHRSYFQVQSEPQVTIFLSHLQQNLLHQYFVEKFVTYCTSVVEEKANNDRFFLSGRRKKLNDQIPQLGRLWFHCFSNQHCDLDWSCPWCLIEKNPFLPFFQKNSSWIYPFLFRVLILLTY